MLTGAEAGVGHGIWYGSVHEMHQVWFLPYPTVVVGKGNGPRGALGPQSFGALELEGNKRAVLGLNDADWTISNAGAKFGMADQDREMRRGV